MILNPVMALKTVTLLGIIRPSLSRALIRMHCAASSCSTMIVADRRALSLAGGDGDEEKDV